MTMTTLAPHLNSPITTPKRRKLVEALRKISRASRAKNSATPIRKSLARLWQDLAQKRKERELRASSPDNSFRLLRCNNRFVGFKWP